MKVPLTSGSPSYASHMAVPKGWGLEVEEAGGGRSLEFPAAAAVPAMESAGHVLTSCGPHACCDPPARLTSCTSAGFGLP